MCQKDYLTEIQAVSIILQAKTNDEVQQPMKEAEKECPQEVRTNLDSAMPWNL